MTAAALTRRAFAPRRAVQAPAGAPSMQWPPRVLHGQQLLFAQTWMGSRIRPGYVLHVDFDRHAFYDDGLYIIDLYEPGAVGGERWSGIREFFQSVTRGLLIDGDGSGNDMQPCPPLHAGWIRINGYVLGIYRPEELK